MSDKTEPSNESMSIGDQLLVDKLASGNADLSDLGRVVAKTYQQTDHQTKVLDEHSQKLEELSLRVDELSPAVSTLTRSHQRGKWIVRTCLGILTFLGVGALTEAYNGSTRLAWVFSLSEPKITDIAQKEATKVGDRLEKDIASVNHRVDLTEVEINLKKSSK